MNSFMKVYLEVYGCTANKSDAVLVKSIIRDSRHDIVENLENSDAIILLTCTVINTTEQRMLSRLRVFRKTDKKIIVSGCMASAQPDLIYSIIPNAILLHPQYIYHIIDLLEEKNISFDKKNKSSISKYYENIVAPIAISEGCMLSCSYCITSLARGRLKSYPIDEILSSVNDALKQGCKEIQLTSQDTASYGIDLGNNLANLLLNICNIRGDFRIRVGMMNPYHAIKNLSSLIRAFNNNRIFKFLHLPVQSGDDEILKKMNRNYKINDFLEIINKFRDKYNDFTLSTDVIVGFPTETDDQFQNTVDLLKKIKPDITNITKFSSRPFTKAKKMNGRISTDIVKERSKILSELCSKISVVKNRSYIGKKFKVLILTKDNNGIYKGRIDNYKPVFIKEKVEIGEFKKIEITESNSTHLFGSII